MYSDSTPQSLLKKPDSNLYAKKNELYPFEEPSKLEFFSQKCDASLFMFGSHNKKRPHNIVMGRHFNFHVYDMLEFGVTEFKSISDFKVRLTYTHYTARALLRDRAHGAKAASPAFCFKAQSFKPTKSIASFPT
jgi:hypothetical protein